MRTTRRSYRDGICGLAVAVMPAVVRADQPCLVDHWTGLGSYSALGHSVALHGETVLISEHGQNMVRIYRRFATGWTQSDPLVGSGAFGFAVATSGDRCVATSPNTKKTFVFEWDGRKWSETAVLEPSGIVPPPTDPHYGHAVAIDGNTIAVGAYYDNPQGTGSGSVFVHRFNGVEWIEEAKLCPLDAKPGDQFGTAVAVLGDRVVASAPWADAPVLDSGAIYVFDRSSTGSWAQTAKIACPKPKSLAPFGEALVLAPDELWAGARLADGNSKNSGVVYRFWEAAPSVWMPKSELWATNSQGGSPFFGLTIARAGDLAVVGAPGDQQNGGAVFVFSRNLNDEWKQIAKLVAPDYGPQDDFGTAVAIGASLAVVGVEWDEPAGYASGSAYLLAVGPDLNNNGLMDPCECPGDLNKDWIVDQADLGLLLANWGCTGGLGYDPSKKACPGAQTGCCGDLDADGDVDQADLGVMLQNFGNVCP